MARPTNLGELKTRCRQRADMENSGFVDDSELVVYINESLAELYDLLVLKYGEDYFTNPKPYELSIDGSKDVYNLPRDFYKARGVDLIIGAKEAISLRQFMFSERNKYSNSYLYTWGQSGASSARYRIIGRKIWFIPSATSAKNIQIFYIPHAPVLEDDADEFDAINGWEQYIIVDTAIKMLSKEESDISALSLEKANLIKRINSSARNRDAGRSQRVSDVSQNNSDYLDGIN